MRLSPTAVKQFKELWLNEFKVQLTDKEAINKASSLMSLYETVYKPIPKSDAYWLTNKKEFEYVQI